LQWRKTGWHYRSNADGANPVHRAEQANTDYRKLVSEARWESRGVFRIGRDIRLAAAKAEKGFDADVITLLKATDLEPKRTSVESPWQNGIAERWVGSCRLKILDHVIALNEEHLRRLLSDYVNYYHDDRIHDFLENETPNRRAVEHKPSAEAVVHSNARLGGLHHRYAWREAA